MKASVLADWFVRAWLGEQHPLLGNCVDPPVEDRRVLPPDDTCTADGEGLLYKCWPVQQTRRLTCEGVAAICQHRQVVLHQVHGCWVGPEQVLVAEVCPLAVLRSAEDLSQEPRHASCWRGSNASKQT